MTGGKERERVSADVAAIEIILILFSVQCSPESKADSEPHPSVSETHLAP